MQYSKVKSNDLFIQICNHPFYVICYVNPNQAVRLQLYNSRPTYGSHKAVECSACLSRIRENCDSSIENKINESPN